MSISKAFIPTTEESIKKEQEENLKKDLENFKETTIISLPAKRHGRTLVAKIKRKYAPDIYEPADKLRTLLNSLPVELHSLFQEHYSHDPIFCATIERWRHGSERLEHFLLQCIFALIGIKDKEHNETMQKVYGIQKP